VLQSYSHLCFPSDALVLVLPHFVEVDSQLALVVVLEGTREDSLALELVLAIARVLFKSIAFDEVECRLCVEVKQRLHECVNLVSERLLYFVLLTPCLED
jgi:hypothetical protein